MSVKATTPSTHPNERNGFLRRTIDFIGADNLSLLFALLALVLPLAAIPLARKLGVGDSARNPGMVVTGLVLWIGDEGSFLALSLAGGGDPQAVPGIAHAMLFAYAILAAMLLEPMSLALARAAGEAIAAVRGATVVDAIVMASAALRGDMVWTSDMDDLGRLAPYFPEVRLLAV